MQNLIPRVGCLYYKRLNNFEKFYFLKLFIKKRREVNKKDRPLYTGI